VFPEDNEFSHSVLDGRV